MEKIESELKKAIIAYRDYCYTQALEDAHDERDEKLEQYLERERSKVEDEKLVDQVKDLILDSFGS